MIYFLINIGVAIWIHSDAKKRLNSGFGWALGTVFIGFIVLPLYLSKRNLKQGEVRSGGTAWQVAKNLALTWTVLILSMTIYTWLISVTGAYDHAARTVDLDPVFHTREKADAEALGASLGAVAILALWFVSTIIIIAFGMLFKKQTVETGPTGAMAVHPSQITPAT